MKNGYKGVLFLLSIAVSLAAEWNWDEIDLADRTFPAKFLWGTATSQYQVSGALNCPNSQWAEWEKRGHPAILNGQTSEKSCDHLRWYREDFRLMKEFGLNSYRFSIEWSNFEPEEGVFKDGIINGYGTFLKYMKRCGITPMITLHHFTVPKWFQDKGGFEKEENIKYFVRFCEKMFQQFGTSVNLWCTINEPTVYVLMGYMLGEFPPGVCNMQKAGEVFKNLLIAHTRVYDKLKKMPGGSEAQIGIVHQYLRFVPKHQWNPVEYWPCYYLTMNLQEAFMRFFREGEFKFHFPWVADVEYSDPSAVNSFDFFGLNYYSQAVIGMKPSIFEPLQADCFDGQVWTDMPYAMYPEGFYKAIMDCNSFGKPIYVTENGIADAQDNRRETFINQYTYALSKAIQDGADVRGYYYWSFIDNFEWNQGWPMKFGLFSFDPKTFQRTLKPGAFAYKQLISEWKEMHSTH